MEDINVQGKIEFDRKDVGGDLEAAALPVIKFLHKVGYQVLTHIEDGDVMVIEYCFDPRIHDFGCATFAAVSVEELETINFNRRDD